MVRLIDCFGQNVSEYYFWKYGRNNHNVNDLDQMETDVVFENFYVCAMECAKVRISKKHDFTGGQGWWWRGGTPL